MQLIEMYFLFYLTRGSNIHGAPYDFRKAANEHSDYFDKVCTSNF
jgi:hypothetical protein